MSLKRKLKPDRNITGAVIPLSMLPIFGIATLIFGLPTGLAALAIMGCAYALFYLFMYARTGNNALLFVFFYGLFLVIIIFTLRNLVIAGINESKEIKVALFSGAFFFGSIFIYLVVNRKLKWRGREIFEMAGEAVDESGNGYTARPRPVGKVEYTPDQIRSFARFCARKLIALPYHTSRNVTLVPIKMGDEFTRLLGLSGDYRDATWINFDVDGEVSVHIAQKDYLDYRQPLAFDQLCTSLGQLFIDFFDQYNRGEGERVIDRMDDLQIPVFS